MRELLHRILLDKSRLILQKVILEPLEEVFLTVHIAFIPGVFAVLLLPVIVFSFDGFALTINLDYVADFGIQRHGVSDCSIKRVLDIAVIIPATFVVNQRETVSEAAGIAVQFGDPVRLPVGAIIDVLFKRVEFLLE